MDSYQIFYNNTTYVIGTVYRHPNSNNKYFIECLNEAISELNNAK